MFYNFVFHLVIGLAACMQLHSNYNYSLVNEHALLSEPLLLSHRLPNALQRPPLIQHFALRKYELRDTGYYIDDSSLSQIDHQLLYQMEPPAGVFAFEVMSIQNYHLLQIRQFQIGFTNPSLKFKLCINEIVVDSEEVKRNDQRGTLPFCLSPGQHQLFNFSLYISSRHPALVRVTVYFIIQILDGKSLVEEKTYARKIYTTVAQNHLKLQTIHFKKCPVNQNIVFHNYQTYEIGLRLEARRRLHTINGQVIEGQIRLRPGKEIVLQVQGKANQLIVHSYAASDMKKFPSLLIKALCDQLLSIDYQNIGILTDQKMVIDLPLFVTSRHTQNITLIEIQLDATTQTVQLEERQSFIPIIHPHSRNIPIAMIRIHSSKSPERRSTITVKVKYETNSEERIVVQKFVYSQIRNAVSAGQKRFIDVTKVTNKLLQSRFPIKNNLNVPIYLNRIIVDQSIFQLTWQTERRRLIYPNHSVQEFSLIYVGSLSLPLSSLKYLALLQFNGHILVPLQITIYDHTLQCLYNNIVHKCSRLPSLDFGYFAHLQSKSKQLVVRNWNPESKQISLGINQSQAYLNGYNASLKVYRPGGLGGGDHDMKHSKQIMQLILKPHQFLLLSIQIQPFSNATSGKITLHLDTENELIGSQLSVHVQNGTIALIPQVIRFTNSYSKQIQYINLVSTYSQQYNIAEVSTNLTGLSVHYNQPPNILKNQWVGMSIVYDPSAHQSNNYQLGTLHNQISYLKHRIHQDFQKVKYAKVKLTTTTDLKTNSTVIIEQKFPQIIAEAKLSSQLQGVFEIEKIILKRKKKSNKKQQRYTGQILLTLTNPLDSAIKYSLNLLSQPKMRDVEKTLKQYQMYNSSQIEDGFLCVSEENKMKWGITVNTIKTLFRLQKQPEQCTLQLGSQEIIVYNNLKQKITINNNLTILYLIKSFRNLCKTCYRFVHKPYVHRLIDTQLVNKVLQEEGFPLLNDFLKAQLNYLEDLHIFELDYLDFHSRIKQDFSKFCQKYPDIIMFRFCHYLNSRITHITDPSNKSRFQISPNKSLILYPGQTHIVSLSLSFPIGKEKAQFFLILSNNFTQFETYRINARLQEPFCRIEPLRSQFQWPEEIIIRAKKGPHQLEVFINKGDYREQEGLIEGSRAFEIINEGQTQIEIAHVGIDQKQFTCSHPNIWINGLTCSQKDIGGSDWTARAPKNSIISRQHQPQSFKLRPRERYNFTVHFQFMIGKQKFFKSTYFPINPQRMTFSVYIYDIKGYYFRLNVHFKLGDNQLKNNLHQLSRKGQREPLVSYYALIIISLTFICILLVRLKDDTIQKTKRPGIQQEIRGYGRLNRMKKLGKIIRQSSYSDTDSCIGSRLIRKAAERPVHTISQDLLMSVRQVNHRQLKKYFNQSEQSEIGGVVGFNHHLSLSHSISYEQEQQDHDNNHQPPNQLIQLADSPRIGEESEQPQSEGSSSSLPEGQEVQLTDDFDSDSAIFDFNNSNSFSVQKNTTSLIQENQFYNVFRSQVNLKKQASLDDVLYKHPKIE